MHYGELKKCDIANGIGVRVTLFVSGCTNRCPDCFQPQTWDFDYGKEFTEDTKAEIFAELDKPFVNGLTVLGGEPFEPRNQRELLPLLREVKAKYPQITDAVLSDLCPATEPEAIASWAEKYAAYNPIDTSKVERKPQQTEDALARKVAMQAEFPSGTSHPKRQPGDAYKRVMERQKARKRSK